jgi:hypothetical protein
MLKLVDQNVLFTILYSDDILLASTSVEELKKALEILDRLLATFNLALDHSKTQFIRNLMNFFLKLMYFIIGKMELGVI